jgi:hypothetical protein
MKVIDSSIPASMYTIDEHNNTFRMFAFGLDTIRQSTTRHTPDFYAQCFWTSCPSGGGWTRTGTPTLSS